MISRLIPVGVTTLNVTGIVAEATVIGMSVVAALAVTLSNATAQLADCTISGVSSATTENATA